MNRQLNMVVCGLTGQGLVMFTSIVSQALFLEGYKVLTTDIPPITHRYSSTYSFIRMGEDIYSPSISEGEADLIVAFEPLEALKVGLKFVGEKGIIIMNEKSIAESRIFSADLLNPDDYKYPTIEDILNYFKRAKINNIIHFNAWDVAVKKTGTPLSLNIVMLGAAVGIGLIPVPTKIFENAIDATVPKGTLKANLEAFQAGFQTVKELLPSQRG